MPLVVTDLGEVEVLRWMLKTVPGNGDPLHLHLYKNDYTPDRSSLLGAFVEADFGSYSPADMARSGWQNPVSVNGVAYAFHGTDLVTWTSSGASQMVYGYYVTGNDDAVALWAERFGTPITVTSVVPVQVWPYMRLHSEFEPPPPP